MHWKMIIFAVAAFILDLIICNLAVKLLEKLAVINTKVSSFSTSFATSSYVALGLDATVDWNNIDFKFKNTLNYF